MQACKSSQPGKLFEVVEEEESFFLGEIMDVYSEVQSNPTKSLWIATILVDKKPVNLKLDSVADVLLSCHTIPSLTLICRYSTA